MKYNYLRNSKKSKKVKKVKNVKKIKNPKSKQSKKYKKKIIKRIFIGGGVSEQLMNKEIKKEDIQIVNESKPIGSGKFGVIFKGIYDGKDVVVKQLKTETMTQELYDEFRNEAEIGMILGKHINIVELIGVVMDGNNIAKIVSSLCNRGSLYDYLKNRKGDNFYDKRFDKILFMCKDIAAGMEHITSLNIVHRDLATRNILLHDDGKSTYCKIADFGLSRMMDENKRHIGKSRELLPWRWLSPEVLDKKIFTEKSDVWSYGCSIYEILEQGKEPYWFDKRLIPKEIYTDIRLYKIHLTFPENIELLNINMKLKYRQLWGIILKTLKYDPKDRISFKQLVKELSEYKFGISF